MVRFKCTVCSYKFKVKTLNIGNTFATYSLKRGQNDQYILHIEQIIIILTVIIIIIMIIIIIHYIFIYIMYKHIDKIACLKCSSS